MINNLKLSKQDLRMHRREFYSIYVQCIHSESNTFVYCKVEEVDHLLCNESVDDSLLYTCTANQMHYNFKQIYNAKPILVDTLVNIIDKSL